MTAAMEVADGDDGALVALDDVSVTYGSARGGVQAVDGVTLSIRRGEVFGLVGESGCGKSTLAMLLMGLLPKSAHLGGSATYRGRNLLDLDEEGWRRLRGDRISLITQDPRSALDPMLPVGAQVADVVRAHQTVSRRRAKAIALSMLEQTGIANAHERYRDPPHRFSGGMCQRVVIAAALCNEPDLLLADEPTTALDVTIQAQILGLLNEMRERSGTTVLLVTHDMGVVAQMCDRVGVMYAGRLVEVGDADEVLSRPSHPYTAALLRASPGQSGRGRLAVIPGEVPDLRHPPAGCRFKTRCPYRIAACDGEPPLDDVGSSHAVACWRPDAVASEGSPGSGGRSEAAVE